MAFGAPREVLAAHQPSEVAAVLDRAHACASAGAWCVGLVRYEAASAFDPGLTTGQADGPLAWFAVYERGEARLAAGLSSADDREPGGQAGYAPMCWRASLQRADFDRRIAAIHEAIASGEIYQANLTAPVTSPFSGDAMALFEALQRAQPDTYAAFIDTGHERILSVSPELFFDWRDGRLLSRPMKGTARRGATPAEDAANAAALLASDKERAENLMIVDLIRNDMSRIAEPHSVRVPALFQIRAWPTVWQMTSDVTSRPRAGTRLSDIFRAMFPCGSITGAPKRQAMRWIHALEAGPRGVYCGAIGVMEPGGATSFNVAIRTVCIEGDLARCGIGSGVTSDATAAGEWGEWRHKRAFLNRAAQPFQILETLRLVDGRFRDIDLHLARAAESARHFDFDWNDGHARNELLALAERSSGGAMRVRLLSDRRGRITVSAASIDGPHDARNAETVEIILADRPLENADSEFVRHKTTRRDHYDAFTAGQSDGVFDTLLFNERLELTEFTRGNVALKLDGQWVTPAASSGLLPGIARSRLMADGTLLEQVVHVSRLKDASELAFINALRGWLPATLVERP